MSPQNPLKPVKDMAPLETRLEAARELAHHPRIRVFDLESRLGTHYSRDTVIGLKRIFPHTRFVWMMGADNLRQIRHWWRWPDIFCALPIAVFARPSYCLGALAELPAQRFARHRLPAAAARRLAETKPPAWIFLPIKLDPHSATLIRARHRAHSQSR